MHKMLVCLRCWPGLPLFQLTKPTPVFELLLSENNLIQNPVNSEHSTSATEKLLPLDQRLAPIWGKEFATGN